MNLRRNPRSQPQLDAHAFRRALAANPNCNFMLQENPYRTDFFLRFVSPATAARYSKDTKVRFRHALRTALLLSQALLLSYLLSGEAHITPAISFAILAALLTNSISLLLSFSSPKYAPLPLAAPFYITLSLLTYLASA